MGSLCRLQELKTAQRSRIEEQRQTQRLQREATLATLTSIRKAAAARQKKECARLQRTVQLSREASTNEKRETVFFQTAKRTVFKKKKKKAKKKKKQIETPTQTEKKTDGSSKQALQGPKLLHTHSQLNVQEAGQLKLLEDIEVDLMIKLKRSQQRQEDELARLKEKFDSKSPIYQEYKERARLLQAKYAPPPPSKKTHPKQ